MKKKFSLLALVIFMLSIFTVGCASKDKADNSLEEIKNKGEFIVGLDDNLPPMGFRGENGQIVGFDIDLANEAAKRMGVKAVFKPVDWDGVVLSLNNKDIDVIWNGLTITEKRQKQIDFSKPYLENRQVLVVKSDSTIKNEKDLKDKVLGIQLGSSSEIALNSKPDVVKSLKEVRKFSNNTEALMDLKASRVDAVLVDEVVGRYYISKQPNVYKVLSEDLGKELYGVGIRKNDKTFKEELDKVLDEMKKDGTAAKISEKWFGENIVK
jgi:polar amino acid transport system substrate-binding protein